MAVRPTRSLRASDIFRLFGEEYPHQDFAISSACASTRIASHSVSFASDPSRIQSVAPSVDGSALLIVPAATSVPGEYVLLRCADPRAAFARVLREFFTDAPKAGVHPSASIGGTATIHATVSIGPNCVVGERTTIGAHTVLRAGVVIGPDVSIGEHCLLKSNSVVGEEGFGIIQGKDGVNERMPQLGGVRIGNHVEIGSLSTVCSGTLDATEVGDWVKIDDHVHIAHNCHLGRGSILTACAELSGSVHIGEGCWIGPNAALINGCRIGDRVLVGIGSVVTKSFASDLVIAGVPARILRHTAEDQSRS